MNANFARPLSDFEIVTTCRLYTLEQAAAFYGWDIIKMFIKGRRYLNKQGILIDVLRWPDGVSTVWVRPEGFGPKSPEALKESYHCARMGPALADGWLK